MNTLVFVYNGDSGLFNALIHLAHKTLAPKTYPCRLCALTYGPLGLRAEWKSFVRGLGRPVIFLHRDEFHTRYGLREISLPAVFVESEGKQVHLWIDALTLNAMMSLGQLMQTIQDRLRVEAPKTTETPVDGVAHDH